MADSTATLGIAVESAEASRNLRDFAAIVKQATDAATKFEANLARLNNGLAGLPTGLRNATGEASRHATQMEGVATSTQKASAAATILTGVLRGMIAALVGGGLYKALELSINKLAELGDRASDTRLSTDLLQGLRIGAAQARVSTDELNKALDAFTEISKRAAPEAKEFYKALSNISPALAQAFKDQAGKAGGQEERLKIIADALKNARNETERYQLAQKALGTDNDRVIDLFIQGRQALDDYVAKAREYGILVDSAFIKKSQEAQRTLGTLSSVLADKLRVAIVDLIPDLIRLIPHLQAVAKVLGDVASLFLKPEDQFTETLRGKLDGINSQIQQLEALNQEIASGQKTPPFSGIFPWFKDEAIKKNEEQIRRLRDQAAETQAILTGRSVGEAARAQPPATNDNKPPGFLGRPSLGDDAFTRQTESIRKHIAAMEADARAVGLSVGEHAKLRVEAQLVEAGLRAGMSKAAVEASEKYKQLGQAAADAAMALAKARIASDIKFDRQTAFLSSEDVQIASQLRQLYGDNVPAALASSEAAAMRMNNAFKQVSASIENNLTEGLTDIVSGTKSVSQGFADMANAIIKDIERMIIKLMIVQPLMNALQGALGGGGGFLGSLFGGGGGPLSLAAPGAGTISAGTIGGTAGVLSAIHHTGGVVGGTSAMRYVHPAYFDDAVRYHTGGVAGLKPDEVPAILQRGEIVIPRGGAGSGSAPVINIINQSSGKVEQGGTRQNADGSIDVFIRDAVRGVIADDAGRGGPITKTMKAAIGGFNGQ